MLRFAHHARWHSTLLAAPTSLLKEAAHTYVNDSTAAPHEPPEATQAAAARRVQECKHAALPPGLH